MKRDAVGDAVIRPAEEGDVVEHEVDEKDKLSPIAGLLDAGGDGKVVSCVNGADGRTRMTFLERGGALVWSGLDVITLRAHR
jgi:hypothetical protein